VYSLNRLYYFDALLMYLTPLTKRGVTVHIITIPRPKNRTAPRGVARIAATSVSQPVPIVQSVVVNILEKITNKVKIQ